MLDTQMTEIMDRLSPILEDLDGVARNGFAMYRRIPSEFLVEHSPRAAAVCVYDHMVAEADRRFYEKLNVTPLWIRGLKLWFFEEYNVVIRFKKMDEDGKSRNYPTKQAKAYDRGDELPGLPHPPSRLTVGYLADPTETMIERVQVACPRGRAIDWCAAILPLADRQIGQRHWVVVTRQMGLR